MTQTQGNPAALWLVTLLYAALLVGGTIISYDKAAAQMFGVLGGVSLPVFCSVHALIHSQ